MFGDSCFSVMIISAQVRAITAGNFCAAAEQSTSCIRQQRAKCLAEYLPGLDDRCRMSCQYVVISSKCRAPIAAGFLQHTVSRLKRRLVITEVGQVIVRMLTQQHINKPPSFGGPAFHYHYVFGYAGYTSELTDKINGAVDDIAVYPQTPAIRITDADS